MTLQICLYTPFSHLECMQGRSYGACPHLHISGQEWMSVEENRNVQIGDAFHVDVIKMFATSPSEVRHVRSTLIIKKQILAESHWACGMYGPLYIFLSNCFDGNVDYRQGKLVCTSLITNYKLPCLPSPQARHLRRCQAIKVLKTVITVKYTTKIKSLHMIFFMLGFVLCFY